MRAGAAARGSSPDCRARVGRGVGSGAAGGADGAGAIESAEGARTSASVAGPVRTASQPAAKAKARTIGISARGRCILEFRGGIGK